MGAYADKKYLAWINPANHNTTLHSDGYNGFDYTQSTCVSSCPSKGETICATMGLMSGACNYVGWDTRPRLYRCEITSCDASWSSAACSTSKELAYPSYPSTLPLFFADVIDGWIGLVAGVFSGVVVGALWLILLATHGSGPTPPHCNRPVNPNPTAL